MLLKVDLIRNIILAISVLCFSYGLFHWGNGIGQFNFEALIKSIAQGLAIGHIYFWFQSKLHTNLKSGVFFSLVFIPAGIYFYAFFSVLPFLWFWLLLLIQFLLVFTYESRINWRRIPLLKNILIAVMWFIQLNLIPGLAGNMNLIFTPFLLFYFALSLQVDIEDIEVDNGKINTLAGMLGARNASFLVVFLLSLFSFYINLPWVWIMLTLLVIKLELRLPKGSYDLLLLFLGLYFMFL